MREGEKLISKAPGLEKTAGHLVPVHPRIPPRPGKWQQRREKYQQKIRLWPPSTPPCSACRIFGNVPKRSWSDFAMAEAVRLRQGEPHLRAYPCPVAPGYFHLGHQRPRKTPVKNGLPSV
jgi:hypothetical protein